MRVNAKPAQVNRFVASRDDEGVPTATVESLGSPPELPCVMFTATRAGFAYYASPAGVLQTDAGRAELKRALRRDFPLLWDHLTHRECPDSLAAAEQHLFDLLVIADRAHDDSAVVLELPPTMSLRDAAVLRATFGRACNEIGRRVAAAAAGSLLYALAAEVERGQS